LLSYTFGNTAYAASTVLAAFLGGLALGAYLIGRLVDRWHPSILTYGMLELAIGAYALCVPLLFAGLTRTYVFVFHLLGLGPVGSTAARFVLGSLVIIIPSALMGGTLPALARLVAATREEHQSDLDWLYALNTFGAAAGALVSTFVLMPMWGVYGTLATAFAMNGTIFLYTAWFRKLRAQPISSFRHDEAAPEKPLHPMQELQDEMDPFASSINARGTRLFIMTAAFLTGMITLAYEVIWTHALAFLVGNAVYAFGMMLFTFLSGLAAGAHLVSRLPRNTRTWAWAFSISQVLTAAVVLLTLPVWNHVPDFFALGEGRAFQRALQLDLLALSFLVLLRMIYVAATALRRRWIEVLGESLLLIFLLTRQVPPFPGENAYFVATEAFRFFIAFGLLIVPAVLMGVAFPSLLNLLNRVRRQAGRSVGSVYAANTVGSILGSLLVGFVLLEWLGSYGMLQMAAILNACLGMAFFLLIMRSTRTSRKLAFAAAFAVVLAIAGLLPHGWNVRSLTRGTYVYFDRPWIADRVLYTREDVQGGLTTVIQSGISRILLSNGKFQGNNTGEVEAQVRFAMIPALFAHDYDRALVIGLGTGNSLRTLAAFPFRRIDVVELAPAIVDAAQKWFTDVNAGVMHRDPRVHLSVNDGRNHLLLSQDQYNLITIEVSSIWISGEGDIYNKEFYELCKSHLTQQGVLQQWVQVHHMRPRDFFVILNTAAHVFPHVAFFLGPEQGLLIASSSPLELDNRQLQAFDRSPAIRHELDMIHARTISSLLGEVIVYDQGYRNALSRLSRQFGVRDNLISTDANPYLEYQTPKGNVLPSDFLLDPWFFVRLKDPAFPPDLPIRNLQDAEDRNYMLGLAYEEREDFDAAIGEFSKIKGRRHACALAEIAWAQARQQQPKGATPISPPAVCE
jgi:spermidine synthase